ncbi:MAG: undecaprenyldiphospho-muramoylpentapeptide beta-N-acetylglucosaminyltransferase [Oscillospiraceae bacterium]|nr:undecaprenyldiphospho-muramoylpentapeptide beta-N-acetylglucosaminyltransferase [Oscillospiraceae bacterium]
MRVIFTCGGTAGHVNPALALAGLMRERDSSTEVLFVGAKRGLEKNLIERAGYPFRAVDVSSFHRSWKPKEIRHNLISVKNLITAPHEADAIIREFQPDLAVGTGGYASFPIIRQASKRGIPTAVHESNALPGLTTELLEPYADCIMVGFEACRQYYKHPEKVVVTGTPVRGDFFRMSKEEAKKALGIDDGRPLVVSFWGSLGATSMNRQMAEYFYLEAAKEPFHHIHSVGSIGWDRMRGWVQEYGVNLADHPSLDVREYIYDMATVMRAADLVLSRAGASTISELTALGIPAILVPSPNVTNNHQEKNAQVLADAGGVVMVRESECSGKKLFELSAQILKDEARQREMSNAMLALGVPGAAELILETVLSLRK